MHTARGMFIKGLVLLSQLKRQFNMITFNLSKERRANNFDFINRNPDAQGIDFGLPKNYLPLSYNVTTLRFQKRSYNLFWAPFFFYKLRNYIFSYQLIIY